jgi:hypothetical protein
MSEEKNKKPMSSSHERLVKGYLRPCLAPKFEKYIQDHEMGMSEAINEAVRKLVEPPTKQNIVPK